MTRQHYPPACQVCGASLPHSNPMAWQYHDQQEYKRFFDEAVKRAAALGRPFEDYEVLQPAWDAGFDIVLQMSDRFELVKEATGTSRRLWGLKQEKGTKQ